MGSLQISCFLTEGLFGYSRLTYLHLPKSARSYLIPQSVKIHYFCSGPISVDPICPQPSGLLQSRARVALLSPRSPSLAFRRPPSLVALASSLLRRVFVCADFLPPALGSSHRWREDVSRASRLAWRPVTIALTPTSLNVAAPSIAPRSGVPTSVGEEELREIGAPQTV